MLPYIRLKKEFVVPRYTPTDKILTLLKDELIHLEIEDFELNGKKILFKHKFSEVLTFAHPMAGIDEGEIEINHGTKEIIYSYSTFRIFLISIILCILLTFLLSGNSFSIWNLLSFFILIYGLNWIKIFTRQRKIIHHLAQQLSDINTVDPV